MPKTTIKTNQAGVPSGGTVGQVPVKQSGTDYDVAWGAVPGGGGYSEQNLGKPLYASASGSTKSLNSITSTPDGSVLFAVWFTSDGLDYEFFRYERDTATGQYKFTHSSGVGNNQNDIASCVVVGIYFYVFFENGAGVMRCERLLASDLSGITPVTITGAPLGNDTSAFTDGTDIFVKLTGTTYTQYTISGTTITSAGTITGALTGVVAAFYDAGTVYMTDGLLVNSYTYAGSFTLVASGSYEQARLGDTDSTSTLKGFAYKDTSVLFMAYNMQSSRIASTNTADSLIIKPFSRPV